MPTSIIQKDMSKCLICGSNQRLETHHCIHGTANRKKADKYGLVVRLCNYHHYEVHNLNTSLDTALKQLAQREFEKRYGHKKFMEVFHRNYL